MADRWPRALIRPRKRRRIVPQSGRTSFARSDSRRLGSWRQSARRVNLATFGGTPVQSYEDLAGWYDWKETPIQLAGGQPQIAARADSQRVYLAIEHLQDPLTGPVNYTFFQTDTTAGWKRISNAIPVLEFFIARHGTMVQRELRVSVGAATGAVFDLVITEGFLRRVPMELLRAYERYGIRGKRETAR